ncbi:collagen binding domain-containing protein [Bacillus cytotoxicus]|uniref:collagen binding domain-containing protein n=2 Tax=Bacillus cytotoxicus TaxID=580165 RepID=UPI002448D1D3|nr:collagen binding domain-containing protein [Bacillus cytotoxicus]MDH2860772.1 Ig-like domain-containing protein [Bacillus cytotoxicus]MDH2893136.1 Ig-like domain-containing protein [Bacillus cytotoxicus]
MNSKKWFVLFLVFVVIMSQSFMPITAKAQELNSVGFVDSIEFESTDLYYGQRTKITVKFSEKDNYDLQPGDVLTLTLPQELKGFNKKVALDDYGVCEISSGIAQCTFNEKVSTHTNIRGKFGIDIQVTNVEVDQKKEIQTNLGTLLEMKTITITGPSSGGGNGDGEEQKGPFSYKVGYIDPDNTHEVQWYLMVNYNKDTLNKDITITDSLQGGQKLKKDHFYIVVENSAEYRALTLKDFESQGYGTIKFVNDSTFNITFNKKKASATRFSIMYNVDITEEGEKLQYLKNKYTIKYEIENHRPVSMSEVEQIENITLYGEAEGDRQEKDKERPQVEGMGEEKETEETWETTDELKEEHLKPETAKEEEEEKLQDPKVEKPQVEGMGEEKETEETWETTDELKEEHPKPETAKELEEEKLQDPKVEKPQVEGMGEEKETEETWETTDELKEEHPKPETAKEVEEEEEEKLQDPKVEKPQVEGMGEEKETEETWETTDELKEEHPKPGTAKELKEEKLQDPKVEKPQVEGMGEEKTTEGREFNDSKAEEQGMEETWKTTDELKEEHPELETAKEEEEEKLQDPKVEKPQVEGVDEEKETEETWETMDELEGQPQPEETSRFGKHQVQAKSEVHGSSKGGGKQLPQTGGHMSYGGHVGGVLFVLGLLMLVVNKRKYN